jgi:hypothetical protein
MPRDVEPQHANTFSGEFLAVELAQIGIRRRSSAENPHPISGNQAVFGAAVRAPGDTPNSP